MPFFILFHMPSSHILTEKVDTDMVTVITMVKERKDMATICVWVFGFWQELLCS